MGSDGDGRGSAAESARKPRKRQLVMESSDSEADKYCISTRQNAGAAASVGNAGAGDRGDGDQLVEKAVTVSSEKVSEVKSTDGEGSEKNKEAELEKSSPQPVAKKIRVESVHGSGGGSSGGAAKGGTGGKMLPRGLPTWRFEKPEVRGGRVLDDKGEVDIKASSASKVKEQVTSSDDKRRLVELQKHEKQTPLKTDQGKSVDSGQQEVIRLQGKRGVLRILPKNGKLVRDKGDDKTLSKKTKVDGETGDGKNLPTNIKADERTGDGRIPKKRGVLKLLPKNNDTMMETNDGKHLPKNNGTMMESNDGKLVLKNKVDGETGDARILMKNSRVDKESSDGKILTNKTKLDGEFSGHKMPMQNSTMGLETVAEKFQPRSSNTDGETNKSYKGYKEKSGALAEFQKQDSNGEKRVMGKLVSPIMLRKSDPSVVGVSLGQSMKQQNSKQQQKNSSLNHHQASLSQKDENTKSSEHKNMKKRLLEHKGLLGNLSKKAKSEASDLQGTSVPVLSKLEMKKPRGGPVNKLKQDVRNQIKRLLLDNGWKIELRQRKNKDYEDSVYVSPEGTGYWSITKAYAVYQEQFQSPHNENHMGCSSELNNIIPMDDLAMLKKNIVRRRTNKEIYGAKKKPGGSKSRDSKDILAKRSSRNKHQNRDDGVKINHRRCGLLVRGGTHNMENNMDGYIPYEWKRTVYSWMIDLEVISEDTEVKYMNNKRTRAMLEGKIIRKGIFCGCCSKILTAAKFELHAGSKEKQPYVNIFLKDGKVSLLQCLHDAWEKHTQYEQKGFYKIDLAEDQHDDTCAICGDGGNLLCCDHCASTFHLDCLGIKMPRGDWYCRSCLCRFCGSAQEKTSSSPELLSCSQCSRKYHQACSPGTESDSVCTKPSTSIDCFCSPGCRKVYRRLKKLLGAKNDIEAGFSWSLVRCFSIGQALPTKNKAQAVHCNSKTALAFAVMDECFQPHIDERSGINMIHNVVYNCGSDISRLDFSGFYTFILERGDEVISAASVRIHGTDLAEMPFIGTRGMYRHQGMCRRLLNGIESALCSLNVRKLVISAVPEMENTWTTVFGFKPVEPSKKQRIKSLNLLIINGTGLLEKRLQPTGTVDGQTTAKPASAVGSEKADAKMFGEASASVTPVHVYREFDVANDLEIKCHESPRPLNGNLAGLTSDQPPAAEENDIKRTLERTSTVSVGDNKLHTLPGVNCGDNMLLKAESDNIQEEKCREINGQLIAENTVAEQKCEDKSNSSHSNSHATLVSVDPCSCLSNEVGKSENCPSSELSIGAAPVIGKTESNLTSNSPSVLRSNQEHEKSCVAPVDTNGPIATMDEKPDNHELKTAVADGYIQSSMEAKSLEDITNIVTGTSIDSYIDKDSSEDHSASAVDSGVSVKGSVQETEIIEDKDGSSLPDLKHPSCKYSLAKLTESKSLTSDMVEMDDAAIKVGMTVESCNEARMSAPMLDISNAVRKVVIKPTQTCGDGELCGEDVICSNNRESELASREPVNA
ncbi:hypothetical protein PAHAL_2G040100 [Panicum hallii]|uniref:PHD-type domain-containing protein n=1 Tax=Panicum hallii TaxID=206008 RepID=A0A2S3GVT6_9POAL|nr:uncharacterized protein LOC112879401 [Panicum hallii]PAN09653.1 hypothetical protein PAHAL_2G040100 [Panicum hallii]